MDALAVKSADQLETEGYKKVVDGADAVTLLLSAATILYHEDYEARCAGYLYNAAGKAYTSLLQAKNMFKQVKIILYGSVLQYPWDFDLACRGLPYFIYFNVKRLTFCS